MTRLLERIRTRLPCRLRSLRYLAAGLMLAVAGAAPAQIGSVQRVVPQGTDGNIAYYDLTCKNGDRGDIHVNVDTDEVCAQRYGRPEVCQKSVAIMQAAERVCRG